MKRSISIAASLALAAAMSIPALAQASTASAQASLTNLKFELIDLTPDDNKTPWIAFFRTTTQASYYTVPPYVTEIRDTPGSVSHTNANGSVTASTSLTNFSAALDIDSNNPQMDFDAWSERYDSFTLSANTMLRVTATGAAAGEKHGHILLSSFASLELWMHNPAWAYELDSHTWDVDGNGSSTLSVAVSSGGVMQNGALRTTARTTAWVTAVPEPSTYGMLLAGLGIIGALARRKSQQRG